MTRQATRLLLNWAKSHDKQAQRVLATVMSQAKRQGELIDAKLAKQLMQDVDNKNVFITNQITLNK